METTTNAPAAEESVHTSVRVDVQAEPAALWGSEIVAHLTLPDPAERGAGMLEIDISAPCLTADGQWDGTPDTEHTDATLELPQPDDLERLANALTRLAARAKVVRASQGPLPPMQPMRAGEGSRASRLGGALVSLVVRIVAVQLRRNLAPHVAPAIVEERRTAPHNCPPVCLKTAPPDHSSGAPLCVHGGQYPHLRRGRR